MSRITALEIAKLRVYSVFSNFHKPELYPRIVLVDELLRHYLRALVVILYCLRILQAIQNALERVVEVMAHGREINPKVNLERPGNHQPAITARKMPIEGSLIASHRGLLRQRTMAVQSYHLVGVALGRDLPRD
jgi:hypothetical protein